MANLNVDEIEASGTNENVKISTQGTNGALEVKGASNDGTLQLNCSNNSHGVKLKSPANSAGQNYTMILPDNQIAASKLLKVKSITGSGSTAVGQLEYADAPTTDLSTLNADNFDTGTIPADRYSFTGSQGAGLQLIQKQTVDSDDTISSITFSNLVDGGMYRMIMKAVNLSTSSYIQMRWKDSNNSNLTIQYYRWDGNDDGLENKDYGYNSIEFYCGMFATRYYFEIEFRTATPISGTEQTNWMIAKGMVTGTDDNKLELYASPPDSASGSYSSERIHAIEIVPLSGYLNSGTEILLYKYNES